MKTLSAVLLCSSMLLPATCFAQASFSQTLHQPLPWQSLPQNRAKPISSYKFIAHQAAAPISSGWP